MNPGFYFWLLRSIAEAKGPSIFYSRRTQKNHRASVFRIATAGVPQGGLMGYHVDSFVPAVWL